MFPIAFSVLLDYQCNFECAHCSVGSSPRTKLPMSRELLVDSIREIASLPASALVVFTGGEPTLRKDFLIDAIALARRHKLLTRVITNAWWAQTPAKALEMARDLERAGLDYLQTSYDDYHAPFATIDKIANCVRAASQVGLKVFLAVIADDAATWGKQRVRDELCRLCDTTPERLADLVEIFEDYPTPSGTGETLRPVRHEPQCALDVGCRDLFQTISIHPNGLVKACCGHAMFYSADLTLGRIGEAPLAEMIERGTHNILHWWIRAYGPKRILERLGVTGEYATICHACHVLLNDPTNRRKLVEYLAAHKQEIFVKDVLLADAGKRIVDKMGAKLDEMRRRIDRAGALPQPDPRFLKIIG